MRGGRRYATVTFLCTDIEGSTALWERHPTAMRAAVERHDALLRQAIARYHGCVFRRVGDGTAGYSAYGRLYAIGYIRGLREAVYAAAQ